MRVSRRLVVALAACAYVAVLGSSGAAQAATCPRPPAGEARPWLNSSYSADCRARFVVAALPTTAQKVAALTSDATFTSMGIVLPVGGDGPAGDVTGNGVSQFPAPITLGATWSRAMAARYGNAIGQEFRARNKSLAAAPVLDLMRTWHQGRQAEAFGEDPFLTGSLGAAEIPAVQRNHVEAEAKHLAAYTQETGRAGDAPTATGADAPANFPNDEIISRKAYNEIYLDPFARAAQAGVSLFMCAFPKVNGTFGCENRYAFDKMRHEFGFRGEIVPDFPNAQHSQAPSLNAGCDGCSVTFGGTTLEASVASGAIPVSTLNRMIYDKTVASFKVGLTDNPPPGAPTSTADVRSPAHNRVSEHVDTDGAVLLKNDRGVLPLAARARSLAVIGPSASAAPVYAENGSAYVPPVAAALISPLQGIRNRAPRRLTVNYAQGAAPVGQQPDGAELPLLSAAGEPSLRTTSAGGSAGLTATYFGTPDWSGSPVLTQVEDGVNLNGGIPNASVAPGAPNGNGGTIKVNGWSVRYTGLFTAPKTGLYVFSLGDGGAAKLFVNGARQAQTLDGQFGFATQSARYFRAGQAVHLRVDYTPRESAPGIIGPTQQPLTVAPTIKIGPYVHLGLVGPNTATAGTVAAPGALIADAVAKAKASDVAVVFASDSTGEGVDRSTLSLPGAQNALIAAVARANPHTIVVLNTGGPVTTPWLPRVAGVLEMWYPGDQFGRAAADLLFGDAAPGGRLPQTWPAGERQGPGQTPATFPGVLTPNTTAPTAWTEPFLEGVDIGYRFWQAHHQTPLFPFGYGLAYTRFAYGPVTVARNANGSHTATVKITNTGHAAGRAVPQLYLRFPRAAGEAPWNLKGFAKPALAPGQTKSVAFTLDDRSVRTYDGARDAWQITPGRYTAAIGSSSADLRRRAAFTVRRRSGLGETPGRAPTPPPVVSPAR